MTPIEQTSLRHNVEAALRDVSTLQSRLARLLAELDAEDVDASPIARAVAAATPGARELLAAVVEHGGRAHYSELMVDLDCSSRSLGARRRAVRDQVGDIIHEYPDSHEHWVYELVESAPVDDIKMGLSLASHIREKGELS